MQITCDSHEIIIMLKQYFVQRSYVFLKIVKITYKVNRLFEQPSFKRYFKHYIVSTSKITHNKMYGKLSLVLEIFVWYFQLFLSMVIHRGTNNCRSTNKIYFEIRAVQSYSDFYEHGNFYFFGPSFVHLKSIF